MFVAALVVRLLFLAVWMPGASWRWRAPEFAAAELGIVAQNLYEGHGFSSPLRPGGNEPTAFFAPLVPSLWALVMHLTGGPSGRTKQWIILIQAIPSALIASMFWLTALHIAKRMPRLSPRFATIVALAITFWPESVLRVGDTWYYIWQELGTVVLVYCSIRWTDEPTLRRGIAMGAAAGGVALANPTPLPIAAVAVLVPLFRNREERMAILRSGSAAVAVAFLVVAPWIVRNTMVFDRFIPMRSNFGIELRQGNNPAGSIRQSSTSLNPAVSPTENERFHRMGEEAYTQWAFDEAVKYMRDHPVETATRAFKRIYVIWFTDIFDWWPWHPDRLDSKWWAPGRSLRVQVRRVIPILSAVTLLTVLLMGLLAGRLRRLPYGFLFGSVLLFLTLPYYFTSANDYYSHGLRMWLLLLAIVVLCRAPASPEGGDPGDAPGLLDSSG